MRSVLQHEDPSKDIFTNLKAAAIISLIIVLPFAVLESLNNTITRQNAPDLLALFGLMWLLPVAFIVVLLPIVRTARARESLTASPFNLLFRVAFLALIAMMWGAILLDQAPCLMGVLNCD